MNWYANVFVSSLLVLGVVACASTTRQGRDDAVYVRTNLVGYLPADTKVAIVFSESAVDGPALLEAQDGQQFPLDLVRSPAPGWGRFAHYYEVDFSSVTKPGEYRLFVDGSHIWKTHWLRLKRASS